MNKILIFFICFSFSAQAELPQIQLANLYNSNIDISKYLVSEKLDGVRGYWDGEKMFSRKGNEIFVPSWFVKNFPHVAMDGELWIYRRKFELVSGIVRKEVPQDDEWRQVRFMVFDLPKSSEIFLQRVEKIKSLILEANSPYLQMVEQFKISDHQTLIEHLNLVVKNGGEGLMLHRLDSLYQAERNDDLLKLKTFEDAEATVIAHIEGEGKYREKMGALLVENNDKIRFKIGGGFSDEQRKNPPKIGSVITYKFFGKTKNNVPRFVSFMRVRDEK